MRLSDVRAFLVRKDGTREPLKGWSGGHTYVSLRQEGGTTFQTTFAVGDGDIDLDGTLLFHEGETVDVSDRMAQAEARNRERTMAYLRKGWEYDDDMAVKDEEIARLRALLREAKQ